MLEKIWRKIDTDFISGVLYSENALFTSSLKMGMKKNGPVQKSNFWCVWRDSFQLHEFLSRNSIIFLLVGHTFVWNDSTRFVWEELINHCKIWFERSLRQIFYASSLLSRSYYCSSFRTTSPTSFLLLCHQTLTAKPKEHSALTLGWMDQEYLKKDSHWSSMIWLFFRMS